MKIFESIWDLAMLPIEVVKDIVTLGGTATEEDEPYTKQRLKKLDEDISKD